jgi:hypothetical protein
MKKERFYGNFAIPHVKFKIRIVNHMATSEIIIMDKFHTCLSKSE